MPSKIDGTNGVLQAYDYQTPTTGFSYTFAAGTQTLIMNPAGTLATGTITMPSSPADGMVITIESTQQITALTVQGNTGQSLVGGTMTLRANQPESFIYRLADTTWYPFSGAANSQLVSGTTQASTSGTSIDFTSIPSWVKRITVMFNGVSTNGVSPVIIQLGSGSFQTTGYAGSGASAATGVSPAVTTFTTGLPTAYDSPAARLRHGFITICTLGSNIWTSGGVLGDSSASQITWAGGSVTLSGTLDRLRITTVGGTNTFDAGSINILYE